MITPVFIENCPLETIGSILFMTEEANLNLLI